MTAKPMIHKNTVIIATSLLMCALLVWNHYMTSTYSYPWNYKRSDLLLPHRRKDVLPSPRNESSNQTTFGIARTEKDLVVVFFAVPKTGSRSLSNTFNVLFNRMQYKYIIVPVGDRETSETLTSFLMNIHNRAFTRGHFPIVELPRNYVSISVVRDPLERFISGFNFAKYGDGQIDTSRIRDSADPEYELSIDECVEQSVGYCSTEAISTFTMKFFCGYDPMCRVANEWTYHRAIKNVEQRFLLVGITEDLDTTMNLLERLLPNMTNGLHALYTKKQKGRIIEWQDYLSRKSEEKRKIYITGTKEQPSPHTREKLLRMMSWEYSFYNHVRLKFNRLKERFSI